MMGKFVNEYAKQKHLGVQKNPRQSETTVLIAIHLFGSGILIRVALLKIILSCYYVRIHTSTLAKGIQTITKTFLIDCS